MSLEETPWRMMGREGRGWFPPFLFSLVPLDCFASLWGEALRVIYKVEKRLNFLGNEYLRRTNVTAQCQVHFGLVEGVVASLCQTFWMGIDV